MVDYLLDTKDKIGWQQPVLDKDLSAPPASPSKGDRYIVGPSPTGDWAGHVDDIAEYNGSVWIFITKLKGMFTYAKDEGKLYKYIASWEETGGATIEDAPVDGHTKEGISSNWAYDHKADANAHHTKTSPIDLYNYGGMFLQLLFKSLDGYYTSTSSPASISIDRAGIQLSTGTTKNSKAQLWKTPQYGIVPFTWNKKRRIKFGFHTIYNSAQTLRLFSGGIDLTSAHIGFRTDESSLIGSVGDGSAESTISCGTLVGDSHPLLEAVLTPGEGCEFFVDGVSKGTITTHLPSGTSYANQILAAYLENVAAANKIVTIFRYLFLQEA